MESLETLIDESELLADLNISNKDITDFVIKNEELWTKDIGGFVDSSTYLFVAYILIAIIGLIGNVITCIVIATNKFMHTVTNNYLFNLAISDLLMLVFSFPPLDNYQKYSSDAVCFLRCFFAEASVYVSVLTITAFSIERYLAICHPLFVRPSSQLSRVSRTIPIIWLLGCTSALPIAMQFGLVHYIMHDGIELSKCTIVTSSGSRYLDASSVIFFILPMLLIGCLYTLIGIRLKNSDRGLKNNNGESGRTEEGARSRSTRRIFKLLVSVVAAFFLCWAPFHLQRLMAMHITEILDRERSDRIFKTISHISCVLSYSSIMINPVLYNVMSKKFRQAFRVTFLKNWLLQSFNCETTTNATEAIDLQKYQPRSNQVN